MPELQQKVIRQAQKICWLYVTRNFVAQNLSEIMESSPGIPSDFCAITEANANRVLDFREEERIAEYKRKLEDGEIGFFAIVKGKAAASIWATVNSSSRAFIARRYMKLEAGDALVHDIVTGRAHRGLGIAPFMVRRLAEHLFEHFPIKRFIVDVSIRNTASLRMMHKTGLQVRDTVAYLSAFGTLLFQRQLRRIG